MPPPVLEDATIMPVEKRMDAFFDGGLEFSQFSEATCDPSWMSGLRDFRPAGPASSNLAATADGRTLVIAAEDHDQVLLVGASSLQLEAKIDVEGGPYHVVIGAGDRAYVSARFGGFVQEIDVARRELLRRFEVGTEPMGLDLVDGNTLVVAVAGDASVVRVDLQGGALTRYALPAGEPWSVAAVHGEIVVGFLTAPDLYRIPLDGRPARWASVAYEDPLFFSFGTPGMTQVRTLTPTGDDTVLSAHSVSDPNTVRGTAPSGDDGPPNNLGFPDDGCFGPPGEAGGYGSNGGCFGSAGPAAVDPAFTVLHLDNTGFAPTFTSRSLPAAASQLPGAVAVIQRRAPDVRASADDDVMVLTLARARPQLVLSCRALDRGAIDDPLMTIPLPEIADGMTVAPDGRLFVYSRFSRVLTRLTPTEEGSEAGRRLAFGITHSSPVVPEVLPAGVAAGRILFHRADVEGMNPGQRVACASCHPDGRSDGLTWSFAFGPRNTPSLSGGILDTAPFHWPGDVEDIRHLNQMTIQALMGGEGVADLTMDRIGAYIGSLATPPRRSDLRALTDEEELGRTLFESAETGCLACHSGEDGTDNQNHALVTGSLDDPEATFQTPHLHGLERTAPYLHTGSAPTLEALVQNWIRTDRMGVGSHLSSDEAAALVAYLKTR